MVEITFVVTYVLSEIDNVTCFNWYTESTSGNIRCEMRVQIFHFPLDKIEALGKSGVTKL